MSPNAKPSGLLVLTPTRGAVSIETRRVCLRCSPAPKGACHVQNIC
jgi:hypothetical protein